ncbi:Membrane domain of glycerophosphoryl diester phosphodiesterase [Melghirimyces thermohalophilus]|uniref:Membrane domain of glycerophosphoryl diester phosphodiesterase n=1 Tax=Melghirimyces thermohalophilus TaxID=1236220 RepID=A0A1G6J7E8_9BACL|nr:glycerophosphoryl diester phosphodiesterase membrane domain-containing protein [Melghirimyces thermohalophilus]SDC14607.1 Membrane domain of glycerophosphoryl diester phosphodiesterase [Melghirimyces thermohalophilus]
MESKVNIRVGSRPRSFTGILDGVFRLLRSQLWVVWMVCTVFLGLGSFFLYFSIYRGDSIIGSSLYGPPDPFDLVMMMLSMLVYGLCYLFLAPLVTASVTGITLRQVKEGRRTALKEAFHLIGTFGGRVLGTLLLKWLLILACVAVSVLILLVSGLLMGSATGEWAVSMGTVAILGGVLGFGLLTFLTVRFYLAVPVILEEGSAYWEALKRSWRLTYLSFWRTFGLMVVLGLVLYVFNLIPSVLLPALFVPAGFFLPQGAVTFAHLILSLLVAAFEALAYAPGGILAAILYLERRARKEGADLAEEADRLRRKLV